MTVFPRAANARTDSQKPRGLDVHSNGRLVEDQHGRVRDQGKREADALGLAAGQLVGAPAGDLGQAGELERLVNLERVRVEGGHHRGQLAHGDIADQRARLEHRADQAGGDGLPRRPAEQ